MPKVSKSGRVKIRQIKSDDSVTGDDQHVTLLTKEGLQKLLEEYQHLVSVKRKEIVKRLKEAISYGDLSENSEYEEAKNEQAFVEGRILELDEKIKSARIISEHDKKTKVVQLGMVVKLQNMTTRKKDNVEEFTIVGSTEADPFSYRISNVSPIGRALLGARVGDEVSVSVPAGLYRYKVLDLR